MDVAIVLIFNVQQQNLHKPIVLKVTDVVLKTYPFLTEIAHILAEIDLDVLYLPSPIERNLIDMLTMAINKNIVIYKANVTSNGIHLCRTILAAQLASHELEALISIEKRFHQGQVLVAYDNPLTLRQSFILA